MPHFPPFAHDGVRLIPDPQNESRGIFIYSEREPPPFRFQKVHSHWVSITEGLLMICLCIGSFVLPSLEENKIDLGRFSAYEILLLSHATVWFLVLVGEKLQW